MCYACMPCLSDPTCPVPSTLHSGDRYSRFLHERPLYSIIVRRGAFDFDNECDDNIPTFSHLSAAALYMNEAYIVGIPDIRTMIESVCGGLGTVLCPAR